MPADWCSGACSCGILQLLQIRHHSVSQKSCQDNRRKVSFQSFFVFMCLFHLVFKVCSISCTIWINAWSITAGLCACPIMAPEARKWVTVSLTIHSEDFRQYDIECSWILSPYVLTAQPLALYPWPSRLKVIIEGSSDFCSHSYIALFNSEQ